MKASVLIPLIFFVSAGSVQAAERAGPTEPPVSHFQGSCDSDPDGKKFAAKACYTRYDPGRVGFGASYRPPACEKSKPVSEQQRETLANAYVRAPDYMKAKLCRLTQLFVTRASSRDAWRSWGFWEGPDRPPGKGVYVAISEQQLGAKQSFADAENQTVKALLGLSHNHRRFVARLPGLRTSGPEDPGLMVLGVLAHELGHALLADTNADGTNPRHPRRKVSGPPRSKCFDEAFLGASWEPDRFYGRRWVEFGDQHNNLQKNPDVRVNFDRLRMAVRRGRIDRADDAIRNVYASKEFASVFASLSPEEDFVETYKYRVLADAAQKPSVSFRLNGRDINVLDYLDSGIPAKKVECLRDLGLQTSQ
jgi:hypothetical protein